MTSRSDFARRQRIKPSRSGVEMTSPDWRKTRLPASASDCCFCTVEDRSNLEPGDSPRCSRAARRPGGSKNHAVTCSAGVGTTDAQADLFVIKPRARR